MTCQSKRTAGIVLAAHQGSRALTAQAEKVASPVVGAAQIVQRWPAVQPRIFEVRRLEPAWIVGFPTSQPSQPTCAHTHTRVHMRAWQIRAEVFPVKLKNRLGGLGGWQTQHPCGFQPSNLLANRLKVGRLKQKRES